MSVDQLCQACGLCCDGSLFSRVPLLPDEVVPSTVSVEVTPTGGRAITQRCAALSGTCCTVYSQRPLACCRYECLLFEAVRNEEETLAGALSTVARAKELIAQVKPSFAEARAAVRREGLQTKSPELEKAQAWLKFHFVGHRR